MAQQARKSPVGDVHELAGEMPHVTVAHGPGNNVIYQVGGKSFIFFRNPRPDAVDGTTGEPYRDVIVFWVPSEADKQALVEAADSPFFTTAHFDGHPSVLLRESQLGKLTRQELAELVQDAWLSGASARRAATWLEAHPVEWPSSEESPDQQAKTPHLYGMPKLLICSGWMRTTSSPSDTPLTPR